MSRSFRESYRGRPYQAMKGWYPGKRREAAKSARYMLAALQDEDGVPDIPRNSGGKWINAAYGLLTGGYTGPDMKREIIWRNRRKMMRRRREQP